VFGAPDDRLGEVPVAVIHAASPIDLEQLRTFLEARIARFKIPERVIFSVAPLPRLGTGKIDRRALKAQYAQ
jgi:acyl-CoA synthetase (AMP-forming)/AMP-acid ligase II